MCIRDRYNVYEVTSNDYLLKDGDVVSVREKSKSLEVITLSLAGGARSRYAWLEWDGAAMAGKFLQKPGIVRSKIREIYIIIALVKAKNLFGQM